MTPQGSAGRAALLTVPALLALAASGGPGGAPTPARPAQAATTLCVGVVVDYGHARPTGGVSTYCARVPAGSTGADVLVARAKALHRPLPTYRSGLLCTIDGYPRDGSCGEPAPGGGYRYWSYWHRPAGTSTWQYSRAGATLFHVSNNSTEGWSYQDGGTEMGRKPAGVSFAKVCPPSPSPTPTRKPSAPTGGTPSGGGAATHAPATKRTAAPSRPNASTASTPGATRPSSASSGAPSAASHSTAPVAAAEPASPGASSPHAGDVAATETAGSSGGVPWAAVGGLALVAAVAGGAAWRSHRSRRTPPTVG